MWAFSNKFERISKVAAADHTSRTICTLGLTASQKVGSNFFLMNRRLVPEFKQGFAELCLTLPSQSQVLGTSENSLSVIRLVP